MTGAFQRIGVVNRGESAMRLIRAARELRLQGVMPLTTIALYTNEERQALFVREADEAFGIGSATYTDGYGNRKNRYLDYGALERALLDSGAEAVWAGWGFVAEHADFAELCQRMGIVFIGPTPESMRRLGDKIGSKQLAEQAGVPVAPWSGGPVASLAEAEAQAERLGYPLMVKATAGGGGRGIRRVMERAQLADAFASARSEALKSFGDDTVFLETMMQGARHIEVQIIGDHYGKVWALGVRDCSVQRRNQKLIEESPSPVLAADQSTYLCAAARRLGELAGYRNAGTVEFLYDPISRAFSFMEVNARLQVEHPVTELTTGVDLVKLQLRIAKGEALSGDPPPPQGHAIEVRVNAEDPEQGFVPTPGELILFQQPGGTGVRVDTGFTEGDNVAPQFDSMLAKVVAVGTDRAEAIARLRRALMEMRIAVRGGASNKGFLMGLLGRPEVLASEYDIGWLDRIAVNGTHLVAAYGDVALLYAAVEAYRSEFELEKRSFLATAARGRLQLRSEIGYEFELGYRGKGYHCQVSRIGPNDYRIGVDNEHFDMQLSHHGDKQALLRVGGWRYQALSMVDGQQQLVEINGMPHRISRDDAGLVRTPAPAVVLGFHVEEGQLINRGDRLATLEAMKTEMPVLAPCDGRVVRLLSSPNVQVETGTPLAMIERQEREMQTPQAAPLDFPALARASGRQKPGTEDWQTVLSGLRQMALGFDISPAEAERLIADYKSLGTTDYDAESQTAEDEILQIFVDICELFSHRGDAPAAHDDEQRTAEEYFLLYLRSLDVGTAGVSPGFTEAMRRALRHYGIDSPKRTPELEEAVLWICKAQERAATRSRALVSILERRFNLREQLIEHVDDNFRALLTRLVVAMRRHYPAVSDLAREVRFRYFDWPFFADIWQRAYERIDADLEATLNAPETARHQALEPLVSCPQPLVGVFMERLPDSDPTLRELMLEVLCRRHYRERDLREIHNHTVDGLSVSCAQYDYQGRHLHLLACFTTIEALDRALGTLKTLLPPMREGEDLVLDCYLAEDAAAQDQDQLARRFIELIQSANFARPIRRIVMAMARPGVRKAIKVDRYFTFRCAAGRPVEDVVYRGLHPMMGKRLGLWRLQEFDIERLESSDGIYLFRGTARSNAKDERLFAFAEVRDLTPMLDAHGKVVRLPHLEMMAMETLAAIRLFQSHRSLRGRLHWNRIVLHVWPPIEIDQVQMSEAAHRLGAVIEDLGLEKVSIRGRLRIPGGGLRDTVIEALTPGGREVVLKFRDPPTEPLQPLSEYSRKVVRMRQRGLIYPYEIIRTLVAGGNEGGSDFPPGAFQEYDLDEANTLVPVEREPGNNLASIIVGRISHRSDKYPEGMQRLFLIGDPTLGMGSLAEPECRRIIAALDLAGREGIPVEWFALSAGALIAMDSGTENLDWTARVLRRIIDFTQAGGEINVVVYGINVGAQSYWNAEATMLMHTRGILIMTDEGSMLLTGKRALDYSGAVSAKDNQGIGGYDLIMGVNGQAQYWAADVWEACHLLLRHYDFSYVAPGERFPRRCATDDPPERDVSSFPHGRGEGYGFDTIGDIFSDTGNPGRHKPFDIRRVMAAVVDQDHKWLERWHDLREGESAVVWDVHLGGYPVCLIGTESHPIQRLGFVPMDGPDRWSSGTLFPLSSKKVARAINSASGNRPVVVLANLSGFDGSPESMRRLQLEYGAEIGRAVVNFDGPMVFCGICRYHGGAYVVFSRALNENLEIAALDGSYASVIGGKPAAAVVFAGEVKRRTISDWRLSEIDRKMRDADEASRTALHAQWHELYDKVYSEKLGEVAGQFDETHSVQRARQVGSLHEVVPPARLRPYLIDAVERGIQRVLARSD